VFVETGKERVNSASAGIVRRMTGLLIIGVASLDTLRLGGRIERSAGGAAMYTALAAQRSGAPATLFAPHPDPMPAALAPVAERVTWLGPRVSPEALTRLDIAHHGGGKTTLLKADWGAEGGLIPDDLPDDLHGFDSVHIAALSSARRQLEFLRACRRRGARRISAGTYARLAYGETENVRVLLESADLFFMNENEANGLFGSVAGAKADEGKLLFVTLAERGALVIEGGAVSHLPAPAAREVDPTGAGDVFCGATLAALALGADPVAAAQRGVALASAAVEHLGPAGLFSAR
jgi:sugar/nucleoside kinase (ribokinase family)